MGRGSNDEPPARGMGPHGPKRLFVWLVLAVVCCAPVALALATFELHRRYEEKTSVVSSKKLGYVLMSHLERTVDAIDNFMLSFANSIGDKWTVNDLSRALKDARLPASVIELAVVDRDGRLIASNLGEGRPSPADSWEPEYFHRQFSGAVGNDIYISRPVRDPVSQIWTIQFSRPLREGSGRIRGVLIASYDIGDLTEFYSRLRTDRSMLITLIGGDGVVLARVTGDSTTASMGLDLSGTPIFAMMRASSEGEYRATSTVDGLNRIGYFVSSKKFPLFVLVAAETDYVHAQSRDFQIATVSISIGLGVALLVLGVLVLRYNRLERKLQTRELQASARQREARFLRAFGKMPGVSVVHVSGETANPIGADASEAISPVDAYVRSPEFLSRLSAGEGPAVNVEHFIKDGEEFEIQYVVAPIDSISQDQRGALASGDREFVVFALDRTAARTQENNLYQISKMAALGELVTGLAHEINQPLGVIRLAAANALSGMKRSLPPEHLEEKLNRIVHQTGRLKSIIDHMRIFGRKSDLRREPSLASASIDGALQVVGAQIRLDDISLNVRMPSCGDVRVLCRQEQLEQVLINLLLNARDAIRSRRMQEPGYRGAIEIACDIKVGEQDSSMVEILVRDNAGGIPEAIIGKVFQPFFTTKAAGQGTGLGLSVSFGIIRDNGGSFSVANDAEGAVFTILLPGMMTPASVTLDKAG